MSTLPASTDLHRMHHEDHVPNVRTLREQAAMKRITSIALVLSCLFFAPPAEAIPLNEVVKVIDDANGRYVWGGASLTGADCSGLVSVAQTLAMGLPPHRLGDTRTLLAGRWPGAIPGASPDDAFVIGANSAHMVARVEGVDIESTGTGFKVGEEAASPFDQQFTRVYHIDPQLIRA
jgi:hypothetical protein